MSSFWHHTFSRTNLENLWTYLACPMVAQGWRWWSENVRFRKSQQNLHNCSVSYSSNNHTGHTNSHTAIVLSTTGHPIWVLFLHSGLWLNTGLHDFHVHCQGWIRWLHHHWVSGSCLPQWYSSLEPSWSFQEFLCPRYDLLPFWYTGNHQKISLGYHPCVIHL